MNTANNPKELDSLLKVPDAEAKVPDAEGEDEQVQEPEYWRVSEDYCYLNQDERQEYRGCLETACANWKAGLGGLQTAQALKQLSLDCLVRHAYRRAYWDQIEVGAPLDRKGPGWLSHQEAASRLASGSAIAFRRQLRDLVMQENKEILRESMRATMVWWTTTKQTGELESINDLIDRGANQIAVVLMCRNVGRAAVQSNQLWWTILAHRVVKRLIMPKLSPLHDKDWTPDDASEKARRSELVQGRAIFYIQYIWKTFRSGTMEFEYKNAGQAITYLCGMCLNCEHEIQHEREKEKARKLAEERSMTEPAQISPISHLETLRLIAQYVESDLRPPTIEMESGANLHEQEGIQNYLTTPQERQVHYKGQMWDVLVNALGRNSAMKYWLLTLLNSDGFTWNQITELFDENDCPKRYEDSLPPGVSWEEMNPACWTMKKNAANLRQFFSNARSTVYAELVKDNLAFPSASNS